MKSLLTPLLAIVLLLSVQVRTSYSENFYVFNSTQLQEGLTEAQGNDEDDTLYLAPQRFVINTELTYSSAQNNSLTIRGSGKPFGSLSRTVLDGNFNSRILKIYTDGPGKIILLRNITFKNGRSGSGIGGGLLVTTNSDNIILENCVFENNRSESKIGGAGLTSISGNIDVDNCVFFDNVAEHDPTGALRTYAGGQIEIVNNTFINNMSYLGAGLHAKLFYDSARLYVTNNIFYNNTDTSATTPHDLWITCQTAFDPSALHITYNLLSNSSATNALVESCTSHVNSNNIYDDPLLDDQYHLTKNSPCIDSGTTTVTYMLKDMDGDDRPCDGNGDGLSRIDMGADEYISSSFPWSLFLPSMINSR